MPKRYIAELPKNLLQCVVPAKALGSHANNFVPVFGSEFTETESHYKKLDAASSSIACSK